MRRGIREHLTHLNSIGEFAIVVVLPIEELNGVGIGLGQLATLQSFLDLRQSETGTGQIQTEYQNNESLHPALVQNVGHMLLEECHQHMLLVVDGIVGIIAINTARVEGPEPPRTIF